MRFFKINANKIMIVLFVLAVARMVIVFANDETAVHDPSFFPDNETILFTQCRSDVCHLATYNLISSEFHVFPQPDSESWSDGQVSKNGEIIAFSRRNLDSIERHIAVMDVNGNHVRAVTKQDSDLPFASFPSFSADGRYIVFIRGRYRESGANRLTGRDLFLVDLDIGKEIKLSDFEFYDLNRPYFYRDSEQIIFSALGPSSPAFSQSPFLFEYRNRYGDNRIYLFGGDRPLSFENAGLVPFFKNGSSSFQPSVSVSNEILFVSITNEMDGVRGDYNYDLFINRNGSISRLTDWRSSFSEGGQKVGGARFVNEAALSPDGSKAVFTQDKEGLRNALWVIGTDGKSEVRIDVP
ncbi:MAG: hypothetical protein NUV50_00070 [Rhodospirillales bacterium]|nr:hypothetical protein [Rhodospirillales bacterium]